jgi:hypothetical protein
LRFSFVFVRLRSMYRRCFARSHAMFIGLVISGSELLRSQSERICTDRTSCCRPLHICAPSQPMLNFDFFQYSEDHSLLPCQCINNTKAAIHMRTCMGTCPPKLAHRCRVGLSAPSPLSSSTHDLSNNRHNRIFRIFSTALES